MILVTGGTGLVGMHFIASLLKRGEKVRALKRQDSDMSALEAFFNYSDVDPKAVEWVVGDLLDVPSLELAIDGCDKVIHAAAMVSFHRKDRNRIYEINVQGTENLVNVALDSTAKDFVFISSVASLGRDSKTKNVRESTEWKDDPSLTHYARSKHMAERAVWRGREEGLRVTVVNPGIILGIGDFKRSSAEIFHQIEKGMPFFPPGSNGFVAVQDVVAACDFIAENDLYNERFLLVDKHLSYEQLFQNVADSIGKNAPTKEAPMYLMRLVHWGSSIGEFFTGKRAFVTAEGLRNATNTYHYDNSRFLEKGFTFTPVEEAIRETGTYFRSLV